MTKSNITEYDKVAANNTDVQDVPLGENQMYPADVNNAFREVMADLADVNDGTVALTSPKATAFEVTNNITVGGTVDGRDVATDGTKLDGVEAGATADQTAAEIRTLVDSATDSNVFTDADHSKLDGIAAGAEVNTVDSVNTQTGTVVLDAADVGALALTGGTLTGVLSINKSTGYGNLEMGGPSGAFIDFKSPASDDYDGRIIYTGGTSLQITTLASDEPILLRQGNATKLNTTATGVAVTGNATFDDNGKAIFGAGSDLEISHNGSNSLIKDNGTGNLNLITNGTYISLLGAGGGQNMARLQSGGTVELYHNGNKKLNTNSTGVSVTGNLDASDGIFVGGTNSYIYEGAANQLNFRIGADGPWAEMIDVGGGVMEFGNAGGALALTAAGTERARVSSSGLEVTGRVTSEAATISSFQPTLTLEDTVGGAQDDAQIRADASILRFRNGTSDTTRMTVSLATGDISFFENTGSDVKFFWDSSAERLGLGTSSPTATLDVVGNVVSQVSINAQTGTTYTTVLADQSKLVTLTNASAVTVTIPANSSVAYPVGTKIDFAQLGAGQVTFAGAGGVTVNSTPTLKLRDQYSGASCIKTATDTWLLVGDLATS